MAERGWRASYLDHLADEGRERDLDGFRLDAAEGTADGGVLEHLVAHTLEHADIPGRLRVWSNVLVPTDAGGVPAAEVDVLALTERGILVLEAKNYAGWVFGDELERAWTQSMDHERRRRFYNPIMQNAAHAEAVCDHLVVPEASVVSYVVFSDRAHIERVPRQGRGWRLCRLAELGGLVTADLARRGAVFCGLQLTTLEGRIDELARLSTVPARAAHAREVREANAATTCPRCGQMLVEREGRFGRFWGCSAYPACTYTRGGR